MDEDIRLFESSLRDALKLADERHPQSHPCRRAAFANSVAYTLTGLSGGYGGPSVREHVACCIGQAVHGQVGFDEACALVEESVFGPLTEAHRVAWRQEFCFQDDPEDLAILNG